MNIKAAIWVPVLCVILASLIGWGAWATQSIESKVDKQTYDAHVKNDNDRFERMQNRIEDKLDRIQERLGVR